MRYWAVPAALASQPPQIRAEAADNDPPQPDFDRTMSTKYDKLIDWHNGKPLSLKISREHVTSMRLVAVPFCSSSGDADVVLRLQVGELSSELYQIALTEYQIKLQDYAIKLDHWSRKERDLRDEAAGTRDFSADTAHTLHKISKPWKPMAPSPESYVAYTWTTVSVPSVPVHFKDVVACDADAVAQGVDPLVLTFVQKGSKQHVGQLPTHATALAATATEGIVSTALDAALPAAIQAVASGYPHLGQYEVTQSQLNQPASISYRLVWVAEIRVGNRSTTVVMNERGRVWGSPVPDVLKKAKWTASAVAVIGVAIAVKVVFFAEKVPTPTVAVAPSAAAVVQSPKPAGTPASALVATLPSPAEPSVSRQELGDSVEASASKPSQQAAAQELVAEAAALSEAPAVPTSANVESPAPAALETTRWAVQLGAFADAAGAERARAVAASLGLHAYTETVETAAGPRIRVRCGPYLGHSDVASAMSVLVSARMAATPVKL